MKDYMRVIINALKTWVSEKTRTASDEDIVEMLVQEDTIIAIADNDGGILTDENKNILLW